MTEINPFGMCRNCQHYKPTGEYTKDWDTGDCTWWGICDAQNDVVPSDSMCEKFEEVEKENK